MAKSLLFSAFIFASIISNAQLIPVDSVAQYVNKMVTVYGRVMDGRYLATSNKQPTLLNMGAKFPNQKMTVVIYGDSRSKFGFQPEVSLLNKIIYVKGKVELYNGKPQIVVTSPFEISLNQPGNQTTVKLNTSGKDAVEKSREVVLKSTVKVKGGPGNHFTTVGSLKKGTVIQVLSSSYDWVKIMEITNTTPLVGYIKSEGLREKQ